MAAESGWSAPAPSDDSDRLAALVREARAGRIGDDGFRWLFRRYYRRVYGLFYRRRLSPETCQDLAQETFVQVFRGLGSFRDEARFDAWLYAIALNVYRKSRRRRATLKRNAPEVPLDDAPLEGRAACEPADDETGPLDRLLERERLEVVARALDTLPRGMARAVKLRLYHSLSVREIAIALRLSEESVKSYLARGRKLLRAAVGAAEKEARNPR